jgi:hypothetical protein
MHHNSEVMMNRPMPYKELIIVTSSKSANMYECSFINQICMSITIVNWSELPKKIPGNGRR